MKLDNIVLPDDLVWIDEFASQLVLDTYQITVGGKQYVRTFKRASGIPITLGGEVSYPWISRQTVKELYDLAEQAKSMLLILPDSREFNVRFRYADQPVIDVMPVKEMSVQRDDSWYEVRAIKFLTV